MRSDVIACFPLVSRLSRLFHRSEPASEDALRCHADLLSRLAPGRKGLQRPISLDSCHRKPLSKINRVTRVPRSRATSVDLISGVAVPAVENATVPARLSAFSRRPRLQAPGDADAAPSSCSTADRRPPAAPSPEIPHRMAAPGCIPAAAGSLRRPGDPPVRR